MKKELNRNYSFLLSPFFNNIDYIDMGNMDSMDNMDYRGSRQDNCYYN